MHVQYVRWVFRQTQSGLARHFLSLERNVYLAWKEATKLAVGLRAQADNKYFDAVTLIMSSALKRWYENAEQQMAITRLGLGKNTMALYRRGFEGWAEFSAISAAAASLGGLSGNYSGAAAAKVLFAVEGLI